MILKKFRQNCFNLDSCSRFEARHWKKEILILISNTRLEEIRALVSKHEIDRNKFLFSKDEIGFSLVTDPQLHAGFRKAFERPSEDLPCPPQGPRVHWFVVRRPTSPYRPMSRICLSVATSCPHNGVRLLHDQQHVVIGIERIVAN